MAIACLRLFTVFPLLPDLSVPFFRRRIALATRFDAAFPYFRLPEDFRAATLNPPMSYRDNSVMISYPAGSRCAEEKGVIGAAFAFLETG
jgi:hypothetical protein